ncbi:hypothetical protein [Agrobacterium tumefaciens]|uniref:hypothetical protein n=1 Tax=Agrobacterium tumefaciens TaxID=358 RepID=UPI000A8A6EA5
MTRTLPLFQESGFPKRGIKIPLIDVVCGVARRLWPSKTAINLASRADISERAAKLWLEGRTEPGADSLVALLRSDVGFELLQELMEGSGTRWWEQFGRAVRIAEHSDRLDWHRREIERLQGRNRNA